MSTGTKRSLVTGAGPVFCDKPGHERHSYQSDVADGSIKRVIQQAGLPESFLENG
jgi:hypothetical protein